MQEDAMIKIVLLWQSVIILINYDIETNPVLKYDYLIQTLESEGVGVIQIGKQMLNISMSLFI